MPGINAYILYNIIAKFSFTCSFGHGLNNFDCSKLFASW